MKKIALLFTIVCAGQLYGMKTSLSQLPREVQALVIQALTSGNDIEATVKAIKNASLVNKQLNYIINEQYSYTNLRQFTALMDLLASKFPKEKRVHIAELFGGNIAKEYITLGNKLLNMINEIDTSTNPETFLSTVYKLIQEGADPNFSKGHFIASSSGIIDASEVSILLAITTKILRAYHNPQIKDNLELALIFLLENGANPNTPFYFRDKPYTIFDVINGFGYSGTRKQSREKVLKLLESYAKK